MKKKIYRYEGKDIVVIFDRDRCNHVGECLRGLPKVFNVLRKPWVLPDLADPDTIAEIIMRCPTGSLHFERTDGGDPEPTPGRNTLALERNGPVNIRGDIELRDPGGSLLLEDTRIALCRCGRSRSMPYCDGHHYAADFSDAGRIAHSVDTPAEEPPRGKLVITVHPGGPFILKGPFVLVSADGETEFRGTRTSLCSCGISKNRPFCDGSHHRRGFFAKLFKR